MFEVVLASGEIVHASPHNHPELFWALKGGGAIFGIVTGFVMRTFPNDGIFGGAVAFDDGQEDKLFKELLINIHNIGPEDPSSGYASCASMSGWRDIRCSAYLVNVAGKEDSALLDSLKRLKRRGSQLRHMRMSDAAADLGADADNKFRLSKFSVTVHSNLQVLQEIFGFFHDVSKTWDLRNEDRVAMTFQPFSTHHISRRDNALGFQDVEPPLVMFSFEVRWSTEHKDEYFERATKSLYHRITRNAESLAMLHRFVYANYAAKFQDPFVSYGMDSYRRLKAVRDQYDPLRIFSTLQPGGLKLEGPNEVYLSLTPALMDQFCNWSG